MLERLLERGVSALAERLEVRTISVDGETYLRRFYLFGRMPQDLGERWDDGPPVERLGWLPTTYLHHFLRADADRRLHSHPWIGLGMVLVRGYAETREERQTFQESLHPRISRWLGAGSVQAVTPHTFHRLDYVPPGGAWTLFVAGHPTHQWGYFDEETGRHIPWKEAHEDSNSDPGFTHMAQASDAELDMFAAHWAVMRREGETDQAMKKPAPDYSDAGDSDHRPGS